MESAAGHEKQIATRFQNKQDRSGERMKRKGAEGLTARSPEPAANEEFNGTANAIEGITTHTQSGWDPYEVWRTRVKASAHVQQERERDPLR
jgi:hypothetical protein